jgi:hypothetical protein
MPYIIAKQQEDGSYHYITIEHEASPAYALRTEYNTDEAVDALIAGGNRYSLNSQPSDDSSFSKTSKLNTLTTPAERIVYVFSHREKIWYKAQGEIAAVLGNN